MSETKPKRGTEVIPEMVDPMGKHWTQPRRKDIQMTELTAFMSKEDADKLQVYDYSIPSGVYAGKMWMRQNRLAWYGEENINKSTAFPIFYRKIHLI